MNKRVLRAVIVLLWVFLIFFSVVKLFFAEWFLTIVDNENIVHIGSVIDQSLWMTILANALTGFLAIHFYLCACKSVWKLSFFEYVCVLMYSLAIANLYELFPSITSIIDAGCFIIVPMIIGVNWKRVLGVFTAHTVGQRSCCS